MLVDDVSQRSGRWLAAAA